MTLGDWHCCSQSASAHGYPLKRAREPETENKHEGLFFLFVAYSHMDVTTAVAQW